MNEQPQHVIPGDDFDRGRQDLPPNGEATVSAHDPYMNTTASTLAAMGNHGDFLSAADAAAGARHALLSGDTASADRFIAEVASRIMLAPADAEIPASILDQPESTGSPALDTLLATALVYGLQKRGLAPRTWMIEAPALPTEWLWDGGYDASDAFRDFIRKSTPDLFLSKNILLRERDLIAP